MIDIECLNCRKTVKIPQYVDTKKYDGQVVCQECGALLHIKLVDSKVQGYKLLKKGSTKVEELLEELRQAGKQSDDK